MNLMRSAFLRILPVLLLSTLVATGCDSSGDGGDDIDVSDPSTLVGRYDLVSVVDKQGDLAGEEGVLFEAGEPRTFTEMEDGQTFELSIVVDGQLQFMTDRYDFFFSVSISVSGFPPVTDTEQDEGEWSISGNMLTLDSDTDQGTPDQLTISASGNRITLEDETARFIFEKQ